MQAGKGGSLREGRDLVAEEDAEINSAHKVWV
jgi:hypothetical protein